MSSPEVWLDARERIEAANLVPPERINWPNEAFAEPAPTSVPAPLWLAVEITANFAAPMEIGGGGMWLEEGALWVHAFAPTGTGTIELRQLAKAVANTFRGLPPGPVTYTAAEIGMGEPGDENGNWYRISTRIEYRYQDR
jgi:hypothetical protein